MNVFADDDEFLPSTPRGPDPDAIVVALVVLAMLFTAVFCVIVGGR